MRLRRRVDDAATEVWPQESLARAEDGVEGRHRAARREYPARRVGEQHPVAEPAEDVGLELDQGGRREASSGEAVCRVRKEVGDRGREDAASRDVPEITGA